MIGLMAKTIKILVKIYNFIYKFLIKKLISRATNNYNLRIRIRK